MLQSRLEIKKNNNQNDGFRGAKVQKYPFLHLTVSSNLHIGEKENDKLKM
jgi:hypothetical protein